MSQKYEREAEEIAAVERLYAYEGHPSPYDALNEFHQKFVQAFIGPAEGDARRAARIAGFPNPTWPDALRIKKRPEVSAAIRHVLREQSMEAEEVLQKWTRLARANIKHLVEPGTGGKFKNLNQIDMEDAYFIKKYKKTPTKYGDQIEIEVHPPAVALEKLGKLWGLDGAGEGLTGSELDDAIARGLAIVAAQQAAAASRATGTEGGSAIDAEFSVIEDGAAAGDDEEN